MADGERTWRNSFPTARIDSIAEQPDVELSHLPWNPQGPPVNVLVRASTVSSSRRGSSPRSSDAGSQATAVETIQSRYSELPSIVARSRSGIDGHDSTRNSEAQVGNAGRMNEPDTPRHVPVEERLQNFSLVIADRKRIAHERRHKFKKQADAESRHYNTLRKLKDWIATQKLALTSFEGMLYNLRLRSCPEQPKIEALVDMVHHFYPRRAQVPVEICDFGPTNGKHSTTTLGQIESCWEQKPDWVKVRWIHVPIGVGMLQSSVEDLFLHSTSKKGRPFTHGGLPSFPYLTTRILNVQSQQRSRYMREVCVLSQKLPNLCKVLNGSLYEGDDNKHLQSDISWRAEHLGLREDFWNLAKCDNAFQLSEGHGIGQHGPTSDSDRSDCNIPRQSFSYHSFFESSQLVSDNFRCFHIGDGILLTFGPSSGINYIDKDLPEYLKEPVAALFDNADASVLGNVWKTFSDSGTETWQQDTVEWFLIYLFTEIISTPHTLSQGYNAPSIPQAYLKVVQDLKMRRFSPWKRNESILLVQDYINCIDELSGIVRHLINQLDILKRLEKDCELMDAEYQGKLNNPVGKSMEERVKWATAIVEENYELLNGTFHDARGSMQALFQLRSIEQNELAIVADSQNKAILIFTGVTIIFLPLSFFASYFGMNLRGIINTSRTETYFWTVCGSIAISLIIITTLVAFKHHVLRLLLKICGDRSAYNV